MPVYHCRAWARYNASTGAILASGNIDTMTTSSTGVVRVKMLTAMPDANYSVVGTVKAFGAQAADATFSLCLTTFTKTTTEFEVGIRYMLSGGTKGVYSSDDVNIMVFR